MYERLVHTIRAGESEPVKSAFSGIGIGQNYRFHCIVANDFVQMSSTSTKSHAKFALATPSVASTNFFVADPFPLTPKIGIGNSGWNLKSESF
jgi:hypothetical protein